MGKDFELTIQDPERKKDFVKVFGSDTVYIKSFIPEWANLGGSVEQVYKLDLELLTKEQRENLEKYIVERFKQTEKFVKENLDEIGFPIKKTNTMLCVANPQRWID